MPVPLCRQRAFLLCAVFGALVVACASDPDALDQDEQDLLASEEAASASEQEPALLEPSEEREPTAAQTEAEALAELLEKLETLYADPAAADAQGGGDAELDADAIEFAHELAEQLAEDAQMKSERDASSPELIVQ